MSYIFPSTPPPPKTEVKQRIQQYQKTILKPKETKDVVEEEPKKQVSIKQPVVLPKPEYTHILTVYIEHNVPPARPETEINNTILKETAKVLHNVVHTKMMANNMLVPITWVQQGSVYSNRYYANLEFFGDVAVKKHTLLLMADVVQQMDDLFDFAFSKKEVTKPLVRQVVLL